MESDLKGYRDWLNLLREFTLEDFRPSLVDETERWLDAVGESVQHDTAMIKTLMASKYPRFTLDSVEWTARRVFPQKGQRLVCESEKAAAQIAHWWACREVLLFLTKWLHDAATTLQNLLVDLKTLNSSQSPNMMILKRKRVNRDYAVAMVGGLATNAWVVVEEYRLHLDRTRKQLDTSFQYEEVGVWRSDVHPPMWYDAAKELMLLSVPGMLCAAPLIRAALEREIWESVTPQEGSKFEKYTVLPRKTTTRNDILEAFKTTFVVPPDVIRGLYYWASQVLHRSKGLGLDEMWYAWLIAAKAGDLSPETEKQKTEAADRAIQFLLDRDKILLGPEQCISG